MKKFKIFTDFEKEEAYLNEMAGKGYFLEKYSAIGVYHFREGIPKKLNYRVDYRGFKSRADFENYKTLFEDAGWQHIYGTRYGYNQYFLPKEGKKGDEGIFSTKESAALRYKHLYDMCFGYVTVAIGYFVVLLISSDYNLMNLTFLTPGLWEMNGAEFWRAFFFELPFVFFRIVPVIFLLALGLAYAMWGGKAKKKYELSMKDKF